jgi:predicted O-methyltransferase YrrM
MYNSFQLGYRYVKYLLIASNGKGHGVHSPFVFEFITKVMNDGSNYPCYKQIEAVRKIMLADQRVLTVADFGAGSRTGSTKQRPINAIAASALKPGKFGQLLHRMAAFYQCKTILELGTSLGVTTAYFAQSPSTSMVYTLEGADSIADVAGANFSSLHINNIKQVVGNFDETLQPLLHEIPSPDLVYIDGNHRLEPTLRYFNWLMPHLHEYSIVVFDDIHWSAEMEDAWNTVVKDERITLSIDLFFIGIVFFRKDFKVKQDFIIRF